MSVLNLNPYGPDAFTKGLSVAEGIGNIRARQLANESARMQNDKTRQIMPGDIEAINTKNAADTQYYPQLQGANLGETQARTNLLRTQAEVARLGAQNDNPLALFQTLYKAWENSDPKSAQGVYLGNVLDQMVKGGILGGKHKGLGLGNSGSGRNPSSQQERAQMAQNSGIELNPMGGNRSTFHQGVIPGEDGQSMTIESPTTAQASLSQLRDVSEAEMKVLYPAVTKLLAPYRGTGGYAKFLWDSVAARNGDKSAQKRIEDYNLGMRYLPELASINARQVTGREPGIEAIQEFKKSMFPGAISSGLVGALTPTDIAVKNDAAYQPLQQEAVDAAIGRERQGFPREQPTPAWAPPQEAPWGFINGQFVPPSQETPSMRGAKGSSSPQQLDNLAQQAIAAGADPKAVEQRLRELRSGYGG